LKYFHISYLLSISSPVTWLFILPIHFNEFIFLLLSLLLLTFWNFCIFCVQILYQICVLQIFFPICDMSYHFLNSILLRVNAFNFRKSSFSFMDHSFLIISKNSVKPSVYLLHKHSLCPYYVSSSVINTRNNIINMFVYINSDYKSWNI
jgi:hypothetical protein